MAFDKMGTEPCRRRICFGRGGQDGRERTHGSDPEASGRRTAVHRRVGFVGYLEERQGSFAVVLFVETEPGTLGHLGRRRRRNGRGLPRQAGPRPYKTCAALKTALRLRSGPALRRCSLRQTTQGRQDERRYIAGETPALRQAGLKRLDRYLTRLARGKKRRATAAKR
jgi:hypothetical protein